MLQFTEPRSLKVPRGARTLTLIDITREAAELDAFAGHEQIWLGRDIDRGLTAIVAIHNTALGPALGGTRIWPHETFAAALTDALRLSRGMTLKAAVAGVPFGGGKAVIMADAKTEKTAELLEAYADVLVSLEGQFFTGEDVGLSLGDADFLRRRATNVTGTTAGGSGNPSPVTAHGVFLGLQAALRHQRGTAELDGIRVAVQGLGSVGLALAAELHRRGARLTVADIDAARLEQARARFDAACVGPEEILAADVDIFAPCALGGVLSGDTIPALKASIVAGSANNQLAEESLADLLRAHGILWAPDFVANAGGIINVATELDRGGYDPKRARERVRGIRDTLKEIFDEADRTGTTPLTAAMLLARRRLGETVRAPRTRPARG